jgi:hypothetical protein
MNRCYATLSIKFYALKLVSNKHSSLSGVKDRKWFESVHLGGNKFNSKLASSSINPQILD